MADAGPLNGRREQEALQRSPGTRRGQLPRRNRTSLLFCGNPLGGDAARAATKATQNPIMLRLHLSNRLFDRRERTLERNP
jgi:hypothetical protein